MKKYFLNFLLFLSVLINDISVFGSSYPEMHGVKKNPDEPLYQRDMDDERYKHKDPTAKTQVNKQTDLFDRTTGNWSEFQARLGVQKPGLHNTNEASSNELGFMDKGGMAKVRGEAVSLGKLNALELEPKGRDELGKSKLLNELYVDYSKDINRPHLEHARKIADAQDKLLGNLLEQLKELGVDCKTEKGDKQLEPTNYLQIEKTEHKDTKYNKTMCEELRNKYNCNDMAGITCLKPNVRCGEWKSENIRVSGHELMDKTYGAFHFDHVADEIFEMKLYGPHSRRYGPKGMFGAPHNSVPAMKGYLSQRHKPSGSSYFIEIGDDMHFGWESGVSGVSGRSYSGRRLGGKDYVWNTYIIRYHYRECEHICDKWSDPKWGEQCIQQLR